MAVNWFPDWEFAPLRKGTVEVIQCALVFLGALAVSLALTPLCRTLMRWLGMVDQPNERRINQTPVPRGGGIAVFIAFHLTLALFALLAGNGGISENFHVRWQVAFFIGSAALAVIGFVDDKRGMSPVAKLICQIAVASFLFCSGVRIGGVLHFSFPLLLDYVVTVFWIVGAINAFNLIDGMDGLASGLALIASIGLAGALFFAGRLDDMLPYIALGGACLGFLRYNFHPATVFLGDTGSMFLGLCVATMPLVSGTRLELIPALLVPLLAMGIPIFDTILAIWRRTLRARLPKVMGEVAPGDVRVRIMEPDKDHLHHRLLRRTTNQRTAAWILYAFSGALVTVGLLGTLARERALGVFLIAFAVAVIVIVKHLARVELWDTGRLLSGRRIAIRKGLVMPLYILFDLVALFLAWMLAQWIICSPPSASLLLMQMPLYVGTIFVTLVATNTYRRVWGRAQPSDLALLLWTVMFGVCLGTGLVTICYGIEALNVRFSLVLGAFAILPLILSRLAIESFRDTIQALKRQVLLHNENVTRILVYGAGIRFRNYMREQTVHLAIADRAIIGIIDDDLQFLGRMIYGYNVLGGLADIPAICKKNKIERIVITCVLSEERKKVLLDMAKEFGFKTSIWVNEEYEVASPREAGNGRRDTF